MSALIDGHNRYEICKRNGIEYSIEEMEFADRDEVMLWMIDNQDGRRNLQDYVRVKLQLRKAEIIGRRAKLNQSAAGGDRKSEEYKSLLVNSPKAISEPVNTRVEIAKLAGVGETTVARVKKIEAQATPEQKEKLTRGEASINEVFTQIRQVEKEEKKEATRQERQGVGSNVSTRQSAPDAPV